MKYIAQKLRSKFIITFSPPLKNTHFCNLPHGVVQIGGNSGHDSFPTPNKHQPNLFYFENAKNTQAFDFNSISIFKQS